MNETIGIFADKPSMPTGMAIVCHNLALGLATRSIRVIYFGRFGQEGGFSKQPVAHPYAMEYELVNCEGGVWKPKTVIEAVNHYGVDYLFSEDDFFSARGLVRASLNTGKPLHFLTPIDSLPIHRQAHLVFKQCEKVYVPNSSYKLVKNGVYLPHGVDTKTFYPKPLKRDPDVFTFLWVGRDEPRKALGRFVLALSKVAQEVDCQAIVHCDWRATLATRTARFLRYKRDLPIILTQMELGTQDSLNLTMNSADVLVCTSKAGGFEMSITEAMACGKPAVVTDWTFMNELVETFETGLKIPVSSVCDDTATLYNGKRWGVPLGRKWGNVSILALADAMRYCVNHPDDVNHMGRNAYSKVLMNNNWFSIAGTLYRNMVE